MLTVKRNWKEIKSELQREWKVISDEDWKISKGDERVLVKMLRQRTDLSEDVIESRVNEIFGCHSSYDESAFRNSPYLKSKGSVTFNLR
ncbi:MAG: hypothetical protein K0R29_492 [Pseudobdellovibrio sp.]|jgi:hypothetical protein|nr:hypothetical protein [Pseudobdellovibrio sp.]